MFSRPRAWVSMGVMTAAPRLQGAAARPVDGAGAPAPLIWGRLPPIDTGQPRCSTQSHRPVALLRAPDS